MHSICTVIQYHARRIERFIDVSGIDRYLQKEEVNVLEEGISFKLPELADPQAEKLALALDIRRLAELLVVADAWVEFYNGDEQKLSDVGLNDFLDVIYRLSEHNLEEAPYLSAVRHQARLHLGGKKRFQLKYSTAGGQTNAEMRRSAGPMIDLIVNATSKVLHADEYSVHSHVHNDPWTWLLLLITGQHALYLYRRCNYSHYIEGV